MDGHLKSLGPQPLGLGPNNEEAFVKQEPANNHIQSDMVLNLRLM